MRLKTKYQKLFAILAISVLAGIGAYLTFVSKAAYIPPLIPKVNNADLWHDPIHKGDVFDLSFDIKENGDIGTRNEQFVIALGFDRRNVEFIDIVCGDYAICNYSSYNGPIAFGGRAQHFHFLTKVICMDPLRTHNIVFTPPKRLFTAKIKLIKEMPNEWNYRLLSQQGSWLSYAIGWAPGSCASNPTSQGVNFGGIGSWCGPNPQFYSKEEESEGCDTGFGNIVPGLPIPGTGTGSGGSGSGGSGSGSSGSSAGNGRSSGSGSGNSSNSSSSTSSSSGGSSAIRQGDSDSSVPSSSGQGDVVVDQDVVPDPFYDGRQYDSGSEEDSFRLGGVRVKKSPKVAAILIAVSALVLGGTGYVVWRVRKQS